MTCSHGMPTPASCVDCMEAGPVAPPKAKEPETVVATFRARHPGQCEGCNLPIAVGQLLYRLEPSGRYVHEGCEPSAGGFG